MNVTLQTLLEDPSLVDSMSIEDVEQFLHDHQGKRLPTLRIPVQKRGRLLLGIQRKQHLAINRANKQRKLEERRKANAKLKAYKRLEKQREQDRIREERLQKRIDKLYMFINGLHWRIKDLHTQPDIEKYIHIHARGIGNDIHDCITVWTGLESVESKKAKDKDGKDYNFCNEHFYPRQWAGYEICNFVLEHKEDFTLHLLVDLLRDFCQIHRVTPKENRRLMEHQKVGVFETPEKSYRDAGIELVADENHTKDPIFDILFDRLDEVINRNL